MWELFRVGWSPHKIFSSIGQHTAELEPSKNRKNRLFQKMGPERHFSILAQKCPKMTIFWPKTKNFCLDFLVSLFWPSVCIFSNLFEISTFSTQNRHFWGLFSLSRCQSFLAIWRSLFGHFQNCSYKSVHKSPEKPHIRVLLRKTWLRRLSTREHPKVPKNAFLGDF